MSDGAASETTETEIGTKPERFDVLRFIPYPASEIFAVVRDPAGHVAIDSSGMLQSTTGEPVDGPSAASRPTTCERSSRRSWSCRPAGSAPTVRTRIVRRTARSPRPSVVSRV